MTPPHWHNLKRRLNLIVTRGALGLLMTALALCQSGCFAPFIPLAIQGVGMLGKAIGMGAQAGAMVKHGNDANPEETEVYEQTKLDDSDFDSARSSDPANATKCNGIELITPAIIEFRPDQNGVTQWRELGLGGTGNAPHWTVVSAATGATANAKDIAPGGWSPATNLEHMEFKPPLKTSTKPGLSTFLAYAPDVALADVERDELASLMLDFGPVVGTFKYNGRGFRYSTLNKLPCFVVPQ
jgi:hypothetical protein